MDTDPGLQLQSTISLQLFWGYKTRDITYFPEQ